MPPYRLLFTSWMHTLTEVTELPPWKTSALSNTRLFSVKKKKFLLSPQSFADCSTGGSTDTKKEKQGQLRSSSRHTKCDIFIYFFSFPSYNQCNKKIQKYVRAERFRSKFSKTAPGLGNCLVPWGVRLQEKQECFNTSAPQSCHGESLKRPSSEKALHRYYI